MQQYNPFARLFQQQQREPITVRLAVLDAGQSEDPLKVSLINADPRDTEYACISYDRSRDFGSAEVDLDGEPFAVPKPLEAAMRAIREDHRPRTLWADLLIGNTAEERSAQAREMKTVFENADHVVAWLGPGSVQQDAALDMLGMLAERWKEARRRTKFPDNSNHATPQQMRDCQQYIASATANILQESNTELWENVLEALHNSYFRTTKSITEIILAKAVRMTFGKKSMSWEDFTAASMGYLFVIPIVGYMPNSEFHEAFQRITRLEQATKRKSKGESLELFPMIKDARRTSYGDAREIVFSMLPIITPSKRTEHAADRPSPPEADYSKDLKDVITDACKYIIEERQDVMLWWDERPPCSRGIAGLPSWATDFTTPIAEDRATGQFISPNNGLRGWADPLNNQRIFVDGDGGLHVQAHALDRVVRVSKLFTKENCRKLSVEEWQRLPQLPNETPAQKGARTWRTMVLNVGGGTGATMIEYKEPPQAMEASFQSMIVEERILELLGCTMEELKAQPPELIARARARPDIQALNGLPGYSQPFEELLLKNAVGRRFFFTESGRCGMTAVEERPPPAAGQDELPVPNFDAVMGDPLALPMLASFQDFMAQRDPHVANMLSQAVNGTFAPEQRPPGVRTGDLVVAIIGGFQPYIIRPVQQQNHHEGPSPPPDSRFSTDEWFDARMNQANDETSDETSNEVSAALNSRLKYNFVGDCFLYGVMEGECFKERTLTGAQHYRQNVKTVNITIV